MPPRPVFCTFTQQALASEKNKAIRDRHKLRGGEGDRVYRTVGGGGGGAVAMGA